MYHVIYHANCIDGFASAWAAHSVLDDNTGTTYTPASYGDKPPDVTAQRVYIVDFSYPLDTIRQMQQQAESILILDHHKSAEADLASLVDEGIAQFDMKRSGAGLTWDHFQPDTTRPWIINYVEDRDLWLWALPSSREINAAIGTWPFNFAYWDSWNYLQDAAESQCVAHRDGTAICRYIDQYVSQMCKQSRRITFDGYENIPCVNVPYKGISEVLNELAKDSLFAIGWSQGPDAKYHYSLRSIGNFDVSEVAKRYGGGGHRNSAGFVADAQIIA